MSARGPTDSGTLISGPGLGFAFSIVVVTRLILAFVRRIFTLLSRASAAFITYLVGIFAFHHVDCGAANLEGDLDDGNRGISSRVDDGTHAATESQ